MASGLIGRVVPGGGNGRVDYPIKLTGLVVSMTREAQDITDMKPVKTVVRLNGNNAGVYGTVVQTGPIRAGDAVSLV